VVATEKDKKKRGKAGSLAEAVARAGGLTKWVSHHKL